MAGMISAEVANLGMMYLMTTVTGSLVFLIWRALAKVFDRPGQLHVIYYMTRLVMMFFLIPLSYIVVRICMMDFQNGGSWGIFDCSTPMMRVIFGWFALFWMLGVLTYLLVYIRNFYIIRKVKNSSEPASEELQEIAESCRCALGIKKQVPVYMKKQIFSAFTSGLRNPYVILPDNKDYSLREYELILMHELNHIKYHDVFWNQMANLVWCLNWENPVAWYLVYWNQKWCEAHCDYECVRIMNNGQEYSRFLFKVSKEQSKANKTNLVAAMMFRNKNTTKERIERMFRYRDLKKHKKSVVMIAATVFSLLSVSTVSAATYGIVRGQEAWLLDTMVYEEEEMTPWENYLEEEEFREEDLIRAEYSEEVDGESGISSYAQGGYNVSVSAGKYKKVATFSASAGETIFVTAYSTPEDKMVSAGIIEPDGIWRGVTNVGRIEHDFSLDQTGTYSVYVRNDNKVTVTFSGSYKN